MATTTRTKKKKVKKEENYHCNGCSCRNHCGGLIWSL